MVPWWLVLVALVVGVCVAILLQGLLIASRSGPPLLGRWRGSNSGTEFTIDAEEVAWITHSTKIRAPNPGMTERAWRLE